MSSAEVKAEAEKLVAYWQRLLRIEDWDITVEVPKHDQGSCAKCSFCPTNGRAHILIRNPEMHPPDSSADPDLEMSIVHELLHVRFSTTRYNEGAPEYEGWELAIERTAETLVKLNRGERR